MGGNQHGPAQIGGFSRASGFRQRVDLGVPGHVERAEDRVGTGGNHIISIENTGGKYFMGRPEESSPTTFYEMKFRDPNGVIIDCTHLGWGGSVKDVVPK